MKKLLKLALLLIICSPVFGQDQNLFSRASEEEKEQTPLPDLHEYELLSVNEDIWQELLNNHKAEIQMVIPFQGEMVRLRLTESSFFRDDLVVRTASGNDFRLKERSKSVYYHGTFDEYPNSHFALSILNGEIIGVGSIQGLGNINLGKVKGSENYVFFRESELHGNSNFTCGVDDTPEIDKAPPSSGITDVPKAIGDCVGLYFEVDYDIFLDKDGAIGATDYITAMFNEIFLIYELEDITVYLSDVYIWDIVSPYDGVNDTPTLLDLFGTTTPVWEGDLGHFVSYRGNGGLAWLNVFCSPSQALRKAVSDIHPFFEAVPVYSWTIEVVTHEMGHNFGSPHTHACFWNGDMTAIDGCGPAAGSDEGCAGAIPPFGTIMSYCHLVGGSGIDLGLGFGPQPGDLIREKIIDADCLSGCALNPFMDVEITSFVLSQATCEGDSVLTEITILNNGNEDLVSLDIELFVDAMLTESIEWVGTLMPDSSELVVLPGVFLITGDYTLLVTTSNPNDVEDEVVGNSSVELEITVNEKPLVEVVEFEDVLCFGESSGSIDVLVSGGTPEYEFLWDNDGGTDEDASELVPNIYTLVVSDINGCQDSITQEITQPDEIILTITVTEDAECYGAEEGEANVVVSGGTPGYTYLWSTGGTGVTETGLLGGENTISVTDENLCEMVDTFTVASPTEIITETEIVQADCGMDNGEVLVTVSGGTPGYTYSWSTGDLTEDLIGAYAGMHTLTLTDENDCAVILDYVIPEDLAPEIILDSILHTDCFDDPSGAIYLSGININGSASYEWSTGDFGDVLIEAVGGIYTVVLTDDSNCSDEETFIVESPSEIIIDPTINSVSCNGFADGGINVSIDGGIPSYELEWSTGDITAGIYDLSGGTYEISVTDDRGCIKELSIEVIEPDTITVESEISNEFCDRENGFIELTLTGGTPDFTYAWTTGDVTASIGDLEAGIYNVLITDGNGCIQSFGTTLENIDNFELEVSSIDNLCFGGEMGSGIANVLSGTMPYSYLWSDGQITETANDLETGDYSVIVTDANGCEEELFIEIESPSEIEVASSVSNEVFGDDGQINITTTGGVPTYSYLWNTGDTSEDLFDLAASTYILTITDANGCEREFSFIVDSQLGIDDLGVGFFNVFPNPADAELHIFNSSDMILNEIKLYNSLGQIVLVEKPGINTEHIMDTSTLVPGMYYLILDVEGKLLKSKVLIKR